MSIFINVQVIFDKPYQFNLLRENLNWQQLSTVIQASIIEAADKEPLSLYYTLNGETHTISNQDHLSQLLCLVTNDMLGVRLYGQTQENMESALIMPRSNDAFKQLSKFADLHLTQLESNPCLAKMVGFLAARVVYSPEKPIDEELNQIEEWISRGATMDRGEFKRMIKERKVMWKQGHRKMRSNATEGDEESFEFVGSNPSRRRHRRHGNLGVPVDDESPDNEKSASHVEDKHSDSSPESESGNEGGCRRGGRGRRRHGKHHSYPFGPAAAEFFTRFGGGYRHDLHGFGGPGFEGEHHHAHDRRENLPHTDVDDFSRGFGRKGHHGRHGKKHAKHFGGEKYFVFA